MVTFGMKPERNAWSFRGLAERTASWTGWATRPTPAWQLRGSSSDTRKPDEQKKVNFPLDGVLHAVIEALYIM
jgi:hypothetical protein